MMCRADMDGSDSEAERWHHSFLLLVSSMFAAEVEDLPHDLTSRGDMSHVPFRNMTLRLWLRITVVGSSCIRTSTLEFCCSFRRERVTEWRVLSQVKTTFRPRLFNPKLIEWLLIRCLTASFERKTDLCSLEGQSNLCGRRIALSRRRSLHRRAREYLIPLL